VTLNIEIADKTRSAAVDHSRLEKAVQRVLEDAGFRAAEISVAIVDDGEMQSLNRRYLAHDYPTDVLSFVLDHDEERGTLDGQIIVSADYAAREAPRYGWTSDNELLLYVIHGALHLTGHDDSTAGARQAMRLAEAKHLQTFGLRHCFADE
jgi:probable rRNA maturation factor